RPVCSITIGTSIICGSFGFTSLPCHTPPQRNGHLLWGWVERSACLMRTGDTENRGSFRCGFCSGFYRGPHPVSNERGPLPESVWSAGRALQSHDSTPLRPLRYFPAPQCDPVTTTTSHPVPPDLSGPPATAADPSSSGLPSSCPAPPVPAGRAPAADRFAGPPGTPALRTRCASPVPGPACPWLRARPHACARLPYCRESACAPAPGC